MTTINASRALAPGGEIISETGGAIILEQRGGFVGIGTLIGWSVGRLFGLEAAAGRAIAFSAATRNSLVVLPLAFAVPGAVPILPAIIVTQTLVELISELIYMRLIPKLGAPESKVLAGDDTG